MLTGGDLRCGHAPITFKPRASQRGSVTLLGNAPSALLRLLRATTTTPHRWRRRCSVELGRVVVHLPAHGGPAFGTNVVVLAAGRQNEQKLPPRWGCAATAWAEKAGRLKLTEAVGRSHS